MSKFVCLLLNARGNYKKPEFNAITVFSEPWPPWEVFFFHFFKPRVVNVAISISGRLHRDINSDNSRVDVVALAVGRRNKSGRRKAQRERQCGKTRRIQRTMRQHQTETAVDGTSAGGDEDSKRQDRNESRRRMMGGGQRRQVTKDEARWWGGEEVVY